MTAPPHRASLARPGGRALGLSGGGVLAAVEGALAAPERGETMPRPEKSRG